MAKKKKEKQPSAQSGDGQKSNRRINIYRWQQRKEFTALEAAIIEILKQKGALSNEKIANIFCLQAEDVSIIVKDINREYEDTVQGDFSRYSLCNDFSRDLPDGIAIGKEKNDKPARVIPDSFEDVAFLDRLMESGKLPQSGKFDDNFREVHKAKVFSLEVTYNPNDEDTTFRCGNFKMLDSFRYILEKKLLPKKKK